MSCRSVLICRHVCDLVSYPSPAWKYSNSLIPRPTHKHYIYALEIMDRKKARAVWKQSIKACWDNRCAFCNGTPIDDESLTLDHVKPRSKGGQDLTRNLVPACSRCNTDKASQEWKSWYQLQPFYCPVREAEITAWCQQGDRHVEEWWEIGIGDLEHCIQELDARQGVVH